MILYKEKNLDMATRIQYKHKKNKLYDRYTALFDYNINGHLSRVMQNHGANEFPWGTWWLNEEERGKAYILTNSLWYSRADCVGWNLCDSFLTSRPVWYMAVCSLGSCGLIMHIPSHGIYKKNQGQLTCIRIHSKVIMTPVDVYTCYIHMKTSSNAWTNLQQGSQTQVIYIQDNTW